MGKGGNNDSYSPLIYENDGNSGRKWTKIYIPYTLVTLQLLLAVAVGVLVVSNSDISQFLLHTYQGIAIYIICIVLWFLVQYPLLMFPDSPWNYPLFVLWSILFALTIGLSCSYSEGKGSTVLEATILISVGSIFITLYAFCGWIGGCNFSLMAPSFTGIFLVFCVYVLIQIFHPFADLLTSIYGCIAAMGFCANLFIVGDEMINQEGPISAVLQHYQGVMNFMKQAQRR